MEYCSQLQIRVKLHTTGSFLSPESGYVSFLHRICLPSRELRDYCSTVWILKLLKTYLQCVIRLWYRQLSTTDVINLFHYNLVNSGYFYSQLWYIWKFLLWNTVQKKDLLNADIFSAFSASTWKPSEYCIYCTCSWVKHYMHDCTK